MKPVRIFRLPFFYDSMVHAAVSCRGCQRLLNVMLRVILLSVVLLSGCTGLPKGVEPVQGFELQRYLGKWYEIARLDHRFERGLSHVSATYSLRDDGGVEVLNRGYSAGAQAFEEATGKAYFKEAPETGHLKVSFFGPFYGSYVVFELDPDYQHAYVAGYNHNYLWLLSRTPVVSDEVFDAFIASAQQKGFEVSELIRVDQTPLQ